MMPLSQVLAYNTTHLIDASAHWQVLADQREEVFGAVHNEARILPWEGLGADALHQRTGADYNTALNSADNLRQAASIARDGASTLDQMHSRVMYTLEDAQADGFAPTEELGMVDTRPSANPAVVAQRQAQAQTYSGQLKSQVSDLVAHDTKVGADMRNATAGEGKISFTDFKQDGGPTPGHTITPDPNNHDDKKHQGTFDEAFEGFGKIVTGLLGIGGGTALTVGSGAAEVGSGGLSTPASIAGVLGGLGMIGTGAMAVENGLDQLFHLK